MNIEKQSDLIDIFHDGSLVNIQRIDNIINADIEIMYLAELIDKKFTKFHIQFIDCNIFSFEEWGLENCYVVDIDIINTYNLELLNCKIIDNNYLEISCNSDMAKGGGGILKLKTENMKVFDQNNIEKDIEYMYDLSDQYWRNIHKS